MLLPVFILFPLLLLWLSFSFSLLSLCENIYPKWIWIRNFVRYFKCEKRARAHSAHTHLNMDKMHMKYLWCISKSRDLHILPNDISFVMIFKFSSLNGMSRIDWINEFILNFSTFMWRFGKVFAVDLLLPRRTTYLTHYWIQAEKGWQPHQNMTLIFGILSVHTERMPSNSMNIFTEINLMGIFRKVGTFIKVVGVWRFAANYFIASHRIYWYILCQYWIKA